MGLSLTRDVDAIVECQVAPKLKGPLLPAPAQYNHLPEHIRREIAISADEHAHHRIRFARKNGEGMRNKPLEVENGTMDLVVAIAHGVMGMLHSTGPGAPLHTFIQSQDATYTGFAPGHQFLSSTSFVLTKNMMYCIPLPGVNSYVAEFANLPYAASHVASAPRLLEGVSISDTHVLTLSMSSHPSAFGTIADLTPIFKKTGDTIRFVSELDVSVVFTTVSTMTNFNSVQHPDKVPDPAFAISNPRSQTTKNKANIVWRESAVSGKTLLGVRRPHGPHARRGQHHNVQHGAHWPLRSRRPSRNDKQHRHPGHAPRRESRAQA
jgi:hypothetical protein